jgi:hypothetical protein
MDEKTIHNQFWPLREIVLTEQEKRIIRQRFKDQQTKSLQIQKLFRVMRYTGYTAVGIFGLFVLAWSFLPQNQFVDTSNPLFTLLSPSGQTVQADTLGRFVKVEGIVNISEQWAILPNTEIRAGQTVVLQPWSSLVVQIMGTTFATITGPATFMLEKLPWSNETVLNLLEWSIVEVTNEITPVEFTMNDESKPQENTIVVIKTKLVQVRTETDKSSSFTINQTDTVADVIASVWNVTVKQFMRDSDSQELLVKAGDSAHINTAWIALNVPKTEQEVTKLAVASKELQIRYQKEKNIQDTPLPEQAIIVLSTPTGDVFEAWSASDETLQELSARVSSISASDSNETQNKLPQSLRRQLMSIWTFGTITEESLPAVFAQINQTYTILDLPNPWVSSLESAKSALRALPSHPDLQYTLPAALVWVWKKWANALHAFELTSLNTGKTQPNSWETELSEHDAPSLDVWIADSWTILQETIESNSTLPTGEDSN